MNSHGSIDWLCMPDFDSQSVFGRLLDTDCGHWSICPRDIVQISRKYVKEAMVLETTFVAKSGTAVVTDAMALGKGERGHDLGRRSPHALLRSVACTNGNVHVDFEYSPRPEYGLVLPLLKRVSGGLESRGGASMFLLSTPIDLEIVESAARNEFKLTSGQALHFSLQHRSVLDERPPSWSQTEIADHSADTVEGWQTWSQLHQNYQGPWKELVAHSGRVLQALTYFPTGAIVAAPTTSLPESVGGDRNWDYRFTWVRDASFTLEALWVAACPDEALKFFNFLAEAALTQVRRGADLQIMFGIRGEHDLTERTLPQMRGWRDSSPVRIGNGAWNQRQLDVYGELMGAVFLLRQQLNGLDELTGEFLVSIIDAAASHWQQKDQGIWEIRGEPRHFLYSKLMCWVALDRGIQMAELLHAADRVLSWKQTREEIREAILSQGWSQKAGSFSQAFGTDDLDASSLMIPIVGFLPADDARVLSTIEATVTHLTDQHGLVFRYIAQDGLAGKEGSFLLCTFWLAQSQAMSGQLDRAKVTFAKAVGFANDVGLLSEEILPDTKELLGNFPQAFSHIGLINAAWAIFQRESGASEYEPTMTTSVSTV
ncbi:glycoside hydrolase family 15 protein [Tunturiibacter empetritectus]|uniref:glycoside hydrolase family 15 protein n=1 Tax=Tunturiibacter empetritectus TaxID=3069691 RepID=UPI003D9BD305